MKADTTIKKYINVFFILKGVAHLAKYETLIHSYIAEPLLYPLAQKHNISVLQVHDIVREYKLNELNRNVIKLLKET
tara:strand:- start:297 stop:527 length:231 start_codon:yes stop_codon:yes gene_type:complete